MAVYGAFISAPLGHVLISLLQKVFAGRTSLKAKILQILVSNLIVCSFNFPQEATNPLEALMYLLSFLRYPPSKTQSISRPWPLSRAQGRTTKYERR